MKKLLVALMTVLCVLSVFVGCAKEEAPKAAASTATATTTTTTAPAKAETPAAEEPEAAPAPAATESSEKVVFRIANGAEPESLDPAQVQGVPEHRILQAIFEGLTVVDASGKPAPGVAESWDISEDGTVYTFHLREDAVWSDGVPVTAQDFVYSWTRELDPATAAPYAWFPAMFIKGAAEFNAGTAGPEALGVKALDDHTLQVELIGPLPYVLGALEHYSFAVVPQHAIEKYGKDWIKPENFVGNGPFVLTEWNPQDKIVVTKSETYWDKDNVALDEVVFYASDDNNTNYNMYIAGQIDWNTSVPVDMLDSVMMRPDYQVAPQLSTYYYTINVTKAPLNDVRVRKAISYAIDRETLVDTVTKAGQIPCWGIVPYMNGYDGLGEAQYDPEYAQQLLAEAGYPNGVGFPTISLLYNTDDSHKAIAEYVQQQLKQNLNINIVLENQEWATYLSNRNSGNFDIARAGWVGDYEDPNTFLDMFVTGAGMNGGKYSNEQYDLLIREAATMEAGADRMEVLLTAEDILINQDQAIIPFYYYVSQNLIDTTKWGGWETNTMDYHPVKDVYLK